MTGKLRPEIRLILKNSQKTVHAFYNFLETLYDYKIRGRDSLPSIPFSDEYLYETLQIKTCCDFLLEETSTGGRPSEDARKEFILDMANLYEQITGKRATAPFNNKGSYSGKFFNFVSSSYTPIENIPPSTLAEAIKTALRQV